MQEFQSQLWKNFLHYFFRGCNDLLGNGWDGDECVNEVPQEVKRMEVTIWTIGIFSLFILFRHDKTLFHIGDIIKQMKSSEKHIRLTFVEKILDKTFLISCLLGWLTLVYYKILMRYMVYLLQPCHMTMFFHFLTFTNPDFFAPIVSLLWLPMTAGTMSALIFPATSELKNPFEVEMFWIEHIIIQIVPLYLLLRKQGSILKHFSWNHVFLGNLIVMGLHWWIFEFTNVNFGVNVNFFACPTPDLRIASQIFASYVPWLPSYRNFYMFVFITSSLISSFLYITTARILQYLLEQYCYPKQSHKTKAH